MSWLLQRVDSHKARAEADSPIPRFDTNGDVLTKDEWEQQLARRQGLCIQCGTKTHYISAFPRRLRNAAVYRGVCIPCNPHLMPGSVRWAYEHRGQQPKSATRQGRRETQQGSSNGAPLERHEVLAAVLKNGSFLKRAPREFRDDTEIVLAAMRSQPWVIRFAPERLRNDRQVVVEAVRDMGNSLHYASRQLRDDRAVVLLAVINDGDSLQFASDRLKADKEVVMTAFATCCKPNIPLQVASVALCDDADTMLAFLEQGSGGKCPSTYRVSERLCNDKEFKQKASRIRDKLGVYSKNSDASKLKFPRLKMNRMNATALKSQEMLNENLKGTNNATKETVLLSLGLSTSCTDTWTILRQMPESLRSDRDVFLLAMETSNDVLAYASESLHDDEALVLRAPEYEFRYSSKRLKAKKSVVVAAVVANPRNTCYVAKELLHDVEFLEDLARQVRFGKQLQNMGREKVLSQHATKANRQTWIDVLCEAHDFYNDEASVSALFYFLIQNPSLLLDSAYFQSLQEAGETQAPGFLQAVCSSPEG